MVDRDEFAEPAPSLVSQVVAAVRRRRSAADAVRADPWISILILAAVPIAAAAALDTAALVERVRAARLERQIAPQIERQREILAARRLRARLLPMFGTPPTISDLAERIARLLPADARLQLIERDDKSQLRIEIDCPDPDVVRESLAQDPVLGRLRVIAQGVASGEGVRVVFASPQP